MNTRIKELDFFRGISIIAVMFIHMSSACRVNGVVPSYLLDDFLVMNILSRFSVPGFILISGFFLFYNNKNFSNKTFIKNKFKFLLIPYVLWSIVYSFFGAHLNEKNVNIHIIIDNILYGTASYHLYFIIIIIKFYLVYLLFRNVFSKWNIKITHLIVILLIQIQLNQYFIAKQPVILGFHFISTIFPWIFIFVLGIYLSKNYSTIKENSIKNKYFSLSMVLFFCIYEIGNFFYKLYILKKGFYSAYNGLMIGLTISVLFICISFSNNILNCTSKIIDLITWMGKNSIALFLIHPIIVAMIRMHLENIVFFNYQLLLYIQLIVCFSANILIVYLFKKCKISKFIIGC